MRTATSLTLVAIGAILTFAVTAHPSWLNLQVAGVVIMLVGVAGLFLNRSGYGWLRRRIVLRRGGPKGPVYGHIDQTNYPSSYAMIDPAALQSVQPAPDADGDIEAAPTVPDVPAADESVTEWVSSSDQPPLATEGTVVEEYIEE
jgi:hypothetical protein